jgi:hypothetical protein
VVVVQDCGQTIEQGMIQLAGTNVDAEDGGEDEVKEKVEHCCYVAFMRQVSGGGGRVSFINAYCIACQVCVKHIERWQLQPSPKLRLSYARLPCCGRVLCGCAGSSKHCLNSLHHHAIQVNSCRRTILQASRVTPFRDTNDSLQSLAIETGRKWR